MGMERAINNNLAVMLHDSSTRERGMECIVQQYTEKLYWHIRRYVIDASDTEDALQETFVTAFLNAGSFKSDSDIALRCWLYRIATSHALKTIKKHKANIFTSIESVSAKLSSNMDSEYGMTGDRIALKLQKAVMELPLKQRMVFNLRYYDELPYEEISKITGSSVTTLKTNYHYAVEKIKQKVTCIDNEDE